MRVYFSIIVLVTYSASLAWAGCPASDINNDCEVNIEDLKDLTEQWLGLEGGIADLNGDEKVDITDFALLAGQWQQRGIALAINELMASNNSESGIADPQGEYDDWVEVYNFGDTAIDIGGMYLTDNFDNPTKWQIPLGYSPKTTVPSGGFIIFWVDEDTDDGSFLWLSP